MQPYLPQVRADRLIAASRLWLAIFVWIAVRLEPGLLRAPLPIELLSAYTIYAAILAAFSFRFGLSSPRARLILLILDFVLYSAAIIVSRGAVSPFFVFFVFSMFCAALRFGVRGSVLMTFVAGAVYVGVAVWQHSFTKDPGLVILRMTYLSIVGVLLTHFAAFQQRATEELQQIAAWPRTATPRLDDLLEQALKAAADLLRAPLVVVVVEDTDEPWMNFAELRDGKFERRRVALDFIEAFDRPSAITIPLRGSMSAGRISFAGRQPWSDDDRAIANIISQLLGAQLDQFFLQDAIRRAAVGEERLRLGRDLHDGLLQSLTGVALHIETIAQQTTDPALAGRLRSLQEIIAADQRDLRSFVMQLRPAANGAGAPLAARLRALAGRIATQWKIDIDVAVTPETPVLPNVMMTEVYSLVGEALANAAKHAGASRVRARVNVDGDELLIEVEDDGHGFPFSGTYDLARLDAERVGPVTLKERIASLGGDLMLASSSDGSRLEMRIEL